MSLTSIGRGHSSINLDHMLLFERPICYNSGTLIAVSSLPGRIYIDLRLLRPFLGTIPSL